MKTIDFIILEPNEEGFSYNEVILQQVETNIIPRIDERIFLSNKLLYRVDDIKYDYSKEGKITIRLRQ